MMLLDIFKPDRTRTPRGPKETSVYEAIEKALNAASVSFRRQPKFPCGFPDYVIRANNHGPLLILEAKRDADSHGLMQAAGQFLFYKFQLGGTSNSIHAAICIPNSAAIDACIWAWLKEQKIAIIQPDALVDFWGSL